MLTSVENDQGNDGSWKRVNEARPILSSPDTLTTLALLALSAPNAPDMGKEGKAAQERGLQWLLTAKPDDELQPVVLRLILWRRLGRSDSEWKPLEQQLRSFQNEDGGWSQIKLAKSDAYATGQTLYALAEAGVTKDDAAIRRAQSFLEKSQREDGAWAMTFTSDHGERQGGHEVRTNHPRGECLGRDGASPFRASRDQAWQRGFQLGGQLALADKWLISQQGQGRHDVVSFNLWRKPASQLWTPAIKSSNGVLSSRLSNRTAPHPL